MKKALKITKTMIVTKIRIVVPSDRDRQAEGVGEKQMGRYIIADVLFLKLDSEFTGVH